MAGSTRKSDTRGAILDAAQAALLNYGFRRSSLEDIAREAGVSRTAVYHHFVNKERLFTAIVEEMYAARVRAAEAIAASDRPLADKVAGIIFAKLGYFHTLTRDWRHGAELTAEESDTFARSARVANDAVAALIGRVLSADAAAMTRLASQGLTAERAATIIYSAAAGQRAGAKQSLGALERRIYSAVRLCLADSAAAISVVPQAGPEKRGRK